MKRKKQKIKMKDLTQMALRAYDSYSQFGDPVLSLIMKDCGIENPNSSWRRKVRRIIERERKDFNIDDFVYFKKEHILTTKGALDRIGERELIKKIQQERKEYRERKKAAEELNTTNLKNKHQR